MKKVHFSLAAVGAVAVAAFVVTLTATAARANVSVPECACAHHGEHAHIVPSNSSCQFCGFGGMWTGKTQTVNSRIYKVMKCVQGHYWLERM